MELRNEEMKNIVGGAISYSLLNAISKIITVLYDVGRGTGSTIRRLINKSYCSVK